MHYLMNQGIDLRSGRMLSITIPFLSHRKLRLREVIQLHLGHTLESEPEFELSFDSKALGSILHIGFSRLCIL